MARNTMNGHFGMGLTYRRNSPIIDRAAKAAELRRKLHDARRKLRINEKMHRPEAAMKAYRRVVKIERMLSGMGEAI
jgi:hypothetical protein